MSASRTLGGYDNPVTYREVLDKVEELLNEAERQKRNEQIT